MQNDLKLLEQRWGLALQSASFGVWDLDPVHERVHYSPQWKATLGYGGADVPDSTHTWRERVHPDDLRPMLQALGAHLEGRTPDYAHEFRLRAADGSYRWVLSRGRVAERDATGRALRVVGTLTDLTDRHEAAAQRAQLELLSRMSHELRTPLNAVLGFAQLLKARIGHDDVEVQRQQVLQIEAAGWQLLRMIEQMLASSGAGFSAPASAPPSSPASPAPTASADPAPGSGTPAG
jgi:PAS domain S-box-containing protein